MTSANPTLPELRAVPNNPDLFVAYLTCADARHCWEISVSRHLDRVERPWGWWVSRDNEIGPHKHAGEGDFYDTPEEALESASAYCCGWDEQHPDE